MANLQGDEKTAYVRAMFHRIARRYDLLNTVISGGMHHRWRRLAAGMAVDGLPLPLGEGWGEGAFLCYVLGALCLGHVGDCDEGGPDGLHVHGVVVDSRRES